MALLDLASEPKAQGVSVVVVGAGIAGLTAGWILRQRGFDVRVVEGADFVGGRMSTLSWDGQWIDRAAGTLSPTCELLVEMIDALQLRDRIVPYEQTVGVLRDGRVRHVARMSAGAIARSGLVGPFELAWGRVLTSALWEVRRALRLPWYMDRTWSEADVETAAAWARRELGEAIFDYVIAPLLSSVYLQDPERCSKALLLNVVRASVGGSGLFTLAGGIGTLTAGLAGRLSVETSCPARALTRTKEGVEVRLVGGTVEAHYAVLATTADVARSLYTPNHEAARTLLGVGYRPAVVLGLATSRSWRRDAGMGASDILFFPRRQAGLSVYAIAESSRNNQDVGAGEVFKVVVDGEDATRLLSTSDDAVVDEVVEALEPHLPGLRTALLSSRVVRHPSSIPDVRVGHVGRVMDYLETEDSEERIFLAGDYLGFLNTDHAARSGLEAASRITARAKRR